MSSGAISITSTRWRTRSIPTIRRTSAIKVGPRNLLHTLATDTDDPTVDPRWGKVGKQKITDEGPLPPHPIDGIKYNMETVDEVIRDKTIDFIEQGEVRRQAVLRLDQPHAHACRHASVSQIPGDAQFGERLVDRGGRHGAARRRRRRRHAESQGRRRGGQHDRRLHHRQRRRKLHLARWRSDALCRRQRHGARRRFPRSGDDPLAGQGPAGK